MSHPDLFGASEPQPTAAARPEAVLNDAFARGDLATVLTTIEPLNLNETREAFLKAGFSLRVSKTKPALLRDLEPQILRACLERKNGFALRGE